MSSARIDDLQVTGTLTVAKAFTAPDGSFSNRHIAAGAAVDPAKLGHQRVQTAVLCDHATSAATKRIRIYKVMGATAQIMQFGVEASVAAGAASSITVDLKKNGATVLTATIALDNATAAYTLKTAAGFTSVSLVAGDSLDAEITTVSGANLPKGVSATLTINEDAY